VIVPDVNLLVYAYNSAATQHGRARAWWEACLSGQDGIGLSWLVVLGYLRLVTSRRVLVRPIDASLALTHVRSWLERPPVVILAPGGRHLDVLETLLRATGATSALITDVHLAALAIENQAELCSNDADFARFPGLRWRNPLA
jgi:hypothetical protein